MSVSETPKLDAALTELAETLRRANDEMAAYAPGATLESQMRAALFRQRIRITLMELEPHA